MKKKLNHTFLLMLALLMSLALYACNGATTPTAEVTPTTETTEATEATKEPSATTATSEKVTITVWHGYVETEEKLFSQATTDFMAANPNITIDLLAVPFDELQNKFQTEVASGGGPTLITGPQDRMAGYAQAGLLKTMDDKAAFLSDLVPASVNGGRIDGKLVGVPINNKVVALFYNKTMITAEPKDFAELLGLAADHGLAITGDWFHNYMWAGAFGATFLDASNKVVLDSDAGAAAYAFLKSTCESEGVTCDGNDGDMDTLFRQGEAAFRIQGPWAAGPAITDLGAENVGVMAIPTIAGHGAPRPWNQSEMISMNVDATAEQEAAAVSFISYLTSADVQKLFLDQGNWIPANAKVDTSTNPVVGGFLKQVPNSDPFPVVAELGATWEPMGNAITQILEGVAEPSAALSEAAKLINTANNK